MSDLPEPTPAAVAERVAAQRAELRRRRRWILACRFASLSFAAWYLELIIVEGLDSPFYISVNLFALVTALSSVVVFNYYDPPLLVRDLHAPDGPQRRASWAALRELREEILQPLLQDLAIPEPERTRLVAEMDADELVRRTAHKLRGDRKKFGRIYLAVYLPVTLAYIALVLTHEAGP